MEFKTHIETLKNRFEALSLHQKVAIIIGALFGLFFMVKFIFFVHDLHHHYHKHRHIPLLVREGPRIFVPDQSPLREKLHLQTLKKVAKAHEVIVPGMVEADPENFINLLPPLPGRLASLNVKLGQMVEQGQLLATLISGDIAQAQSDRDKAAAQLLMAEKALARALAVQKTGGNALKDVQMAQMNFEQAKAETSRTIARLKALGDSSFQTLEIKAPMSGQILSINYGLGSYINDTITPLMTLTNISGVFITAFVPENIVNKIKPNQSVDIYLPALPHKVIKGEIQSVNTIMDMDTRRNRVRVYFENKEGLLLPNMFADIHILVPEEPAIIIPNSAIVMNNEQSITFVEVSPWVFVPQKLTLGVGDGTYVRVLAGLEENQKVVVEGGVFIND